tara:strand:- start:144 stop:248 length:105 start_codon:yes stop_codon:yes gene_type:complete
MSYPNQSAREILNEKKAAATKKKAVKKTTKKTAE